MVISYFQGYSIGRAIRMAKGDIVEGFTMNRRLLILLFVLLLLGMSIGSTTAQDSNSLWFGTFWSNTNLEGDPVARASSGEINFDWGDGSPKGVPADFWSGQWTSIVTFSPGTYRFTTQNDDGVGVFLGDKHIIYDWSTHPLVTNQVNVSLLGGDYSMAVSYYDETGIAVLKLAWERIGPPKAGAADVTVFSIPTPIPPPQPPPPQTSWLADYWNNSSLAGATALRRYEAAINYDWGTGSPAPGTINADFFSARWSRSVYFSAGSYRFTTQSDDGIRVFVGDRLIIDNWSSHPLQTDAVDVDLGAGTYTIRVDYYENAGEAVAKFWWERNSGTESAPTGVTATVRTYSLNLRAGPSTSYEILNKMPRHMAVSVIGRTSTNLWLQVVYQGETGWSWAPYMSVSGDLNSIPVTW